MQQFRSYSASSFDLSPAVTVISGANGSGKTNILEALYVGCRGSSFRAADSDLLQFGQPWWRLDLVDEDTKRTIAFDGTKSAGRKQFTINGVKKQRLPAMQKIPVVLFEPNDLRLLEGSPTRRRSFLDAFIAQIEPGYSIHLSRYERALRQRNNLLKADHVSPDELFVWDMSLSENGTHIINKRMQYTAILNQQLNDVYQSIAAGNDIVNVTYETFMNRAEHTQLQQYYLAALHQQHKRDIVLGFTSVGPHRDDLVFTMNGKPAVAVASRGETRTIVLGLKLIEINYLLDTHSIPPLLLLDDVYSELDANRRAALTGVSSEVQTVITTTDADTIENVAASNIRL